MAVKINSQPPVNAIKPLPSKAAASAIKPTASKPAKTGAGMLPSVGQTVASGIAGSQMSSVSNTKSSQTSRQPLACLDT